MTDVSGVDKSAIRDEYDRIATRSDDESSCCPGKGGSETAGFQPSYEDIEGHVPEADLGLGCGIPLEQGELDEGDTVLDLGSGAGNDCFVARRDVGSTGKVIGVDFSEEMIRKARKNAMDLAYNNVEFRHGDIENLPVTDDSIDVVISNCVLNLVPDKTKAFHEIKRVLKPGGYFSVSDVVLNQELPDDVRNNVQNQAGCVATALLDEKYLGIIRKLGFEDINVTEERDLDVREEVFEDFSLSSGRMTEIADWEDSDILAKSITVKAFT